MFTEHHRVYEYFLGQFAGSEGKRGSEFYTPRSVVWVMVEMIEPYKGRVYDPCCGSGGMFAQSEKFALEHEGRISDIAIYGQESNYTTWRLCKMNLATPSCAIGVARSCSSMPANSVIWSTARARSSLTRTSTRSPAPTIPCAARPMPAPYEDVPGFCKSADLEEIRPHGYVLTPGR